MVCLHAVLIEGAGGGGGDPGVMAGRESRAMEGQTGGRPARMITEVVPSPTSSSWALDSSIMLLAAGCLTSISRRMACPSLVMTATGRGLGVRSASKAPVGRHAHGGEQRGGLRRGPQHSPMPPMGSRSILSIERGPSVVRTMSDTA